MQEIPISNKIPELDIAIEAVKKAGNAILEIYHDDYETSTKDDDSPITDADLKSNEVIKRILSQTKHAILSEEDDDDLSRLSKETIWIIDPLDGTSDFIDKRLRSSSSSSDRIACIVCERILLMTSLLLRSASVIGESSSFVDVS